MFINKSTCKRVVFKVYFKTMSGKSNAAKDVKKKAAIFLADRKNANVLLELLSDAEVILLSDIRGIYRATSIYALVQWGKRRLRTV